VVLLGRGDGGFRPVPLPEVGVRVPGEQRSAVIADLDGDGLPELAIGIHGGAVTLLKTRRDDGTKAAEAAPGVRAGADPGR
jgi:hypothetical protein